MKQETGNNIPVDNKKMSIQLVLNGHLFSQTELKPADPQYQSVSVEIVTSKCVLVPKPIFKPDSADALLRLNGIYPDPQETIINAQPADSDIVAVMAVPVGLPEAVAAKYGPRAEFTSPLLRPAPKYNPAVWCLVTAGLAFIKVWNRGLRFAEVVPCATTDDLLYCLSVLDASFHLDDYTIVLGGNTAKETAKIVKKHFKRVVCE